MDSIDATTMDNVIRLLELHLTMAHAAVGGLGVKPEKVNRPTVGMETSTAKWMYSRQRWESYRGACGLHSANCVSAVSLRQALNRQFAGDPTRQTEEEILTTMETLSVNLKNAMVSRV
jgi:hypothetical protein